MNIVVWLCLATALVGCDDAHTDCDSLKSILAAEHAQQQVVHWVDSELAAGRLDARYAVPANVPRPGRFAVPLPPSLGFDDQFVARVVLDAQDRPAAVFIGDARYRGFVIDIVQEPRHYGMPPGTRIGKRVSLLCVPRD